LVQDEHRAEYVSRSILVRIVGSDTLWPHFGTAEAVDRFWALDVGERANIWGAPIDLSPALDGFNPTMLSNADLGLEA
jgi:hypothetical protein